MRRSVKREDVVEALGEDKTQSLEATAKAAGRWSFLDDQSKMWAVVSAPVKDGVVFTYIKY